MLCFCTDFHNVLLNWIHQSALSSERELKKNMQICINLSSEDSCLVMGNYICENAFYWVNIFAQTKVNILTHQRTMLINACFCYTLDNFASCFFSQRTSVIFENSLQAMQWALCVVVVVSYIFWKKYRVLSLTLLLDQNCNCEQNSHTSDCHVEIRVCFF